MWKDAQAEMGCRGGSAMIPDVTGAAPALWIYESKLDPQGQWNEIALSEKPADQRTMLTTRFRDKDVHWGFACA